MSVTWHLITGEYPPDPGGVSDYTRRVAEGLARRGQAVHVWCPGTTDGPADARDTGGVTVHRLRRGFSPAGLPALSRALDALPGPRRLFVQYGPTTFGLRAMNLPFALWLWTRRRDEVWTLFHEVAFPFQRGQPLRRHVLAVVTRLMAATAASASGRVFVTVPRWGELLRRLAPWSPTPEWLPVPSNLPTEVHEPRPPRSAGAVVGHFGTYGPLITRMLDPAIERLLRLRPELTFELLGRGSAEHRHTLVGRSPELADRISATGGLDDEALAARLMQMDLLLQPYPDGVSARRGSLMAGLALGRPIVTHLGPSSEPLWASSGAVALAPSPSADALAETAARLLDDASARETLGRQARALYRRTFSLEVLLDTLLGPAPR